MKTSLIQELLYPFPTVQFAGSAMLGQIFRPSHLRCQFFPEPELLNFRKPAFMRLIFEFVHGITPNTSYHSFSLHQISKNRCMPPCCYALSMKPMMPFHPP
jgi:hypothetical protein